MDVGVLYHRRNIERDDVGSLQGDAVERLAQVSFPGLNLFRNGEVPPAALSACDFRYFCLFMQ